MSFIEPTSLFTAITDTTAAPPRDSSDASASRSTVASGSTGTTVPPVSSTQCSTAWCSAAGHTARPLPRRTAPSTAAFAPSVPPLVNTTSPGVHPMISATMSRDSSMTRRADLARACEPDGFAYSAPM